MFSDGTPLDAKAVEFNLERNVTLNNPRGMRLEIFSALADVEVTGPLTARIHLERPVAGAFYPLLADPETTLVSPRAVRDGVDLNTNPVGAGPFLLESAARENRVVMVPNPDYYAADEVRLAGVEFVHMTASPTAVNALRAEQVDFTVLNPSLAEGVADPVVAEYLPHRAVYLVNVCKANPPLDDVRVRQAMMHAMDREALAARIYGEHAEVAHSLRRADDRYHNPELEGMYERDLDRARQLLADAGYPDGFEVGMFVNAAGGSGQLVGELLQAQWAEAGIDLSLHVLTNAFQEYYIETRQPLYPATQTRLGLDAWTILLLPGAFANVCKYENPEIISVLEGALAMDPDSDEAVDAWQDLSALVFEDLPFLPMVFHTEVIGYNADRLGGLEYWQNNYGNHVPRLDKVYIKA